MNTEILEAIPVPAFLVAQDDSISGANALFQQVFPNLQMGRNYLTVIRQPALDEFVQDLKAGKPVKEIELTILGDAHGAYRATGGIVDQGILICLQDRNETATAIRVRQNFIADLGHELKTPLTSLSGILETSKGDADALAHFLPVMSDEVERMKRLVADLLALSRVESNEMRTPSQIVELRMVVEDAIAPLALLSNDVDMRIQTKLPDKPIHVQGDQDELSRAIKNLVENGLRYGSQGGAVSIKASINDQSKNLMIEVCNDGPGVESHHIPRLTERFYRIDSHRSRNSGGSGLGLAIVKHVVNHHRGKMRIDCPENQGFRVTITLPMVQQDP